MACVLLGPLPRAPRKPPQRPNRRLPRKQFAAKLPMRLGKNDRIQVSREALSDAVLRRVFKLPGVEFIEENGGGPGGRLRKSEKEKLRK